MEFAVGRGAYELNDPPKMVYRSTSIFYVRDYFILCTKGK